MTLRGPYAPLTPPVSKESTSKDRQPYGLTESRGSEGGKTAFPQFEGKNGVRPTPIWSTSAYREAHKARILRVVKESKEEDERVRLDEMADRIRERLHQNRDQQGK